MRFIKFKASTLIETLVALVIILAIFGIVTSFIVKATLNSYSIKKVEAVQLLDNYAAETEDTKAFFDEELEFGKFHVKRSCTAELLSPGIISAEFYVYDRNKQLVAHQRRLFSIR